MKREVPVNELARLYRAGDMVKAETGGCEGCSSCCKDMEIALDPWDLFRLEAGLKLSFSDLMKSRLLLSAEEGLVLPVLRMDSGTEACTFLNREGRCSIHEYRPGLCRLFPLGRYYEGEGFRYYLQESQCPKAGKTKVKVKKWLDMPELSRYEAYILKWHKLVKQIKETFAASGEEALKKQVNTVFLQIFYGAPYETDGDFYIQFETRREEMERLLALVEW